MTERKKTNRYYDGPPSDHFDGHLFFNPDGQAPRGLRDLLRWQVGGGRAKWPTALPSPFPRAMPADRVTGDNLRLTMVGHATLLIQVAGLNILTDPVWSDRASPFSFLGPRRVNPPGVSFDDLPAIDIVLLSHNHYDHLDARTLTKLSRASDPLVITPLGNDRVVAPLAPGLRIDARDWGDAVSISENVKIHVEPAHHWSARRTSDRRMALWAGFVIEAPAGKIYFAGDTGFHGGRNYRLMTQRHDGFRLAILPIGAYEPRWFMEAQHQNPEEAVEGMKLCRAAFAAGCHWGTFQLTNEPAAEPKERLHAALDREGIDRARFRAMHPGEVWDVPPKT